MASKARDETFALSRIVEILESLDDEAAKTRVVRWLLDRYGPPADDRSRDRVT
jgi:hypothetical protein